jgi:hypothetical protein
MIAIKLLAVPAVVWLASWAGRRWGHRISGLISGFPLISAPVVLFLAVDAPRAFIAETAWFTMIVAPAVGAHCLTYAWFSRLPLPRRVHWVVCILAAWSACLATQWLLSEYVVTAWWGALLAIGEMLLAAACMPKARLTTPMPRIPATEIAVRMAAALLMAAIIILGAQSFGPRISGMLLGFPITASVLPLFTLYLYGADATIRLLSGFVTGLLGFVAYFFAFALLVVPLGPFSAFLAGAIASVALVSLVLGGQSGWQSFRNKAAA